MTKQKRTGLMLGIGAVAAALGYLLFFRKKVEAVPANTVTVSIESPPSGAKGWAFIITSHDEVHSVGSEYHTIDEPITQQVPADWFPLYYDVAFFSAPRTAPILEITNKPSLSWYEAYDASLAPIPDYGHYYI